MNSSLCSHLNVNPKFVSDMKKAQHLLKHIVCLRFKASIALRFKPQGCMYTPKRGVSFSNSF